MHLLKILENKLRGPIGFTGPTGPMGAKGKDGVSVQKMILVCSEQGQITGGYCISTDGETCPIEVINE